MQFAAETTHIRQEGDITNHMAAGLPRRPEGNAAVAAAPVRAIAVVPPNVANVEVGVTWRGAQHRLAQLNAPHEVTPQRRLARLDGLPRAAWTHANGGLARSIVLLVALQTAPCRRRQPRRPSLLVSKSFLASCV